MEWKWLFALLFLQDLDWSFFYDSFGFSGLFYAYIFIAWGEVILYTVIAFKAFKRGGLLR